MVERRKGDIAKPASAATPARSGSSAGVDAFLDRLASLPARQAAGRGRLLFAMDATASREPTWDSACHIQGEMFEASQQLGGLDVKLVFYRGFGELKASRWTAQGSELARLMSGVRCFAGHTQIGPVLDFAARESQQRKVDALVFVGDCFEEDLDAVGAAAGRLSLFGTPAFMFHEGHDGVAERAFREIARLTRGAYARFDLASPGELKKLLGAVAVYAAGGRPAMLAYGRREGGAALLLTHEMK